MRHHPQHVAASVGDAGDVRERPVGIAARDASGSVRADVAEGDVAFALQALEALAVTAVYGEGMARVQAARELLDRGYG